MVGPEHCSSLTAQDAPGPSQTELTHTVFPEHPNLQQAPGSGLPFPPFREISKPEGSLPAHRAPGLQNSSHGHICEQ